MRAYLSVEQVARDGNSHSPPYSLLLLQIEYLLVGCSGNITETKVDILIAKLLYCNTRFNCDRTLMYLGLNVNNLKINRWFCNRVEELSSTPTSFNKLGGFIHLFKHSYIKTNIVLWKLCWTVRSNKKNHFLMLGWKLFPIQ